MMALDLPFPGRLRLDLMTQIAPSARDLVERIVAAAARHGAVFAVGGAVRDLILGRSVVDIDLVTEADAIAIMAEALPDSHPTTHDRFRTASIDAGDIWIDVATTRRETYARPGALPDVEAADIEADLGRRDFTMNAIALRLDGEAALLDPYKGLADIDGKVVRVLHHASFIDDPTRIFRAARYATRLGFALEAHTLDLLRGSAAHIAAVGGERLRRELELMIQEPCAGNAFEMCAREGILAATHSALSWDAGRSVALARPVPDDIARTAYAFALLSVGASASEADSIVERLKLTRQQATAVRGLASIGDIAPMLRRPDVKPSGVVVLLDRFPTAAILAFSAATDDAVAGQLALRYVDEWRHIKPLLNGDDIIEIGVPSGPQVHRGLQLIRAARLDGWASDRDDERALAMRFAKSIRDSNTTTDEHRSMDVSFRDN